MLIGDSSTFASVVPAPAAAVFKVLSDPQGHVALVLGRKPEAIAVRTNVATPAMLEFFAISDLVICSVFLAEFGLKFGQLTLQSFAGQDSDDGFRYV